MTVDRTQNPFAYGVAREAFFLALRVQGVTIKELIALADRRGASSVMLLRRLRSGSTQDKKYRWAVNEVDGIVHVYYPLAEA